MDGKRLAPLALIGLFIISAVQIGGFALLWGKDTSPPEYVYLPATADKSAAVTPVNTPVVVVSPPDEKALRGIIQAVLQQELNNYLSHQSTMSNNGLSTIKNPPTVIENSPQNIQAYNETSVIIDNAIMGGMWDRTTNDALLPYIAHLTPAQRIQLLEKIGDAINRQELKVKDVPAGL